MASMHMAKEADDADLRDSVCYWRMSQPQVEARDVDAAASGDEEREDGNASVTSASSSAGEDPEEYEVLYPSNRRTNALLDESEFYHKHMHATDRMSESLLQFCGSFPVRMAPVILASLLRRFTDVRFNWENKTLQSFMEVACWGSVTYAAYSLYHDWLVAFQVGTFVGALMSICDEVVLQFVRGLARVIRNQAGGSELLQQLGFDVPKNGKAPTSGQEVELIKNLVFGYLGVVAIRSLWENFHDVKYFALLTAAVGVSFVVTAEFFCLWLPTRRLGLTLQSRFTKIGQNWEDHFTRSSVELLAWTVATSYFYHVSENFLFSLQLGTLVAIVVCLLSGLEDLPDIVSSDKDRVQEASLSFWQDQSVNDPFLAIAKRFVKIQDTWRYVSAAVEAEALNMYENWGE